MLIIRWITHFPLSYFKYTSTVFWLFKHISAFCNIIVRICNRHSGRLKDLAVFNYKINVYYFCFEQGPCQFIQKQKTHMVVVCGKVKALHHIFHTCQLFHSNVGQNHKVNRYSRHIDIKSVTSSPTFHPGILVLLHILCFSSTQNT